MSAARDAWIDEARSVDILTVARARGAKLKRAGGEWIGACPACGGRDRFSINVRKRIFNCRKGGASGDVIALVEYLDGVRFLEACAILAGPPPDGGGDWRQTEEAELERRRARAAETARLDAEREREQAAYRERERRKAYAIWTEGFALERPEAAPVVAYLTGRGLDVRPLGRVLRFAPALPYWAMLHVPPGGRRNGALFRGPAMLAAITDDQGHFCGTHITWLDPAASKGKREIFDPETGEQLPSKKVRGTLRRGAIKLIDPPGATRLVIGEGIETVLSVARAEAVHAPQRFARTAYWSSVSLGQLGGAALETVVHPTEVAIGKNARSYPRLVPGPAPKRMPERDLMPPARFTLIVLLGDGDSDRFATEMHLRRAAARWDMPGREILCAWAPEGRDFDDLLREAVAGEPVREVA